MMLIIPQKPRKASFIGLYVFIIPVISLILWGCNTNTKKDNLFSIPRSQYNKMQELHIADIKWTSGFWADKFELCRTAVIPAVYNGFKDPQNSEHIDNLKKAAGLMEGEFTGLDFSDGDSYKWIESMAFMFAVTQDPKLDSAMDDWINAIAKAQMPNGYVSTNMQMREQRTPYMETKKGRHAGAFHELYNMGHLLTAACSHYRATRKENFLNVARKLADHLEETLKPGAPELRAMVGNLPNIMGLVDMYRVTGEKRYLVAAQVGLDIRGHMPDTSDFTQDHVPFRDETEAAGHSVFATYLYSGAADIYAETGEKELKEALDRIWASAVYRRSYITGGVCAITDGVSARGDVVHEAFGADYQLPNRAAYNETCANVGNAMWNWRMLMLTGDARYTDIVEKVLFNSMLSALSADGTHFFYANPLKWNFNTEGHSAQHTDTRWATHSCYCCPPQIARTIAGLGRWAYTVSNDTLWVHLYGGNNLHTKLPGGKEIDITQESDYPWDGEIKIRINKAPKKAMALMLRIPGWAENATIKMNGEDFNEPLAEGTYTSIKRKWKTGDEISLSFPMPVRMMEANPGIENNRNCIAVMRGPLVYCAEFPLNENGKEVWEKGIFLSENENFTANMEIGAFGNVMVLNGKAFTAMDREKYLLTQPGVLPFEDSAPWENQLYRRYIPKGSSPVSNEYASMDLKLIPYFAWANRGPAYMTVWLPLFK
jgi:uncharacterized protein